MTLADYILSKSTLPSGTIFDHILAMQTGGGQGTVFASMFSVSVEQPSVVVTRKASLSDTSPQRDVLQPARQPPVQDKNVTVSTHATEMFALLEQDEVSVFTGTSRSTVETKLSAMSVTGRSRYAIK